MTYSLKTAIRIVREEDRHDLIPFFEHIKSDCNKYAYSLSSLEIGEIWFIADDGRLVCTQSIHHKLNNHTILNGVPQGWREEMKLGENIHREIADQYQGLFNLLNKEHGLILTISEMDEIVIESAKISESKINQLESENKEFRECLSEIYKELELWVEGEKQFTSNSKALITQAKQLLNK